MPGRFAEAIEPPLRDTVNPLRQLGGSPHGAAAGDVHGVIVAQAVDQFGEQRGVPGGARGQGEQAGVWQRAERVRKQRRHRVITERGQGNTSGTVFFQDAEQIFHVMLLCVRPGKDPGDRVPL